MNLEDVRREAERCIRCDLHKTRTNVVFGEGKEDADIMFIGEGPGYWEDQKGRPFVGDAGKILTQLIESLGLSREDVYITNVVKCRPPGNRTPTDDEARSCAWFLDRQIELIDPKLIVCLGRTAAQRILGRPVSMNREHGNLVEHHGRKVFITYHPAACLYGKGVREKIEEDFGKLRDEIRKLRRVDLSSFM